jgi:uncharacterized protein
MHCLSESDRTEILDLARKAVVEAVAHQRPLGDVSSTGVLAEHRGVFVTLHAGGKLRGCIGVVQAKEPLGQSVARCAMSAALQDPRFNPMTNEELKTLEVEVSLLSPMERIQPEQIEIGKHGLFVEQGNHRGLLLPQVAVEHGLSRERFLEETCQKAGLPKNAWKSSDVEIYGFTCEIVEEKRG